MAVDTLSLAGKTALVTGSSKENGIGAAIARAFARNGASVAIHHVSEGSRAGAEKLAVDIAREFGTKTTLVRGQVGDYNAARSIVEQALQGLGVNHIDILSTCPLHYAVEFAINYTAANTPCFSQQRWRWRCCLSSGNHTRARRGRVHDQYLWPALPDASRCRNRQDALGRPHHQRGLHRFQDGPQRHRHVRRSQGCAGQPHGILGERGEFPLCCTISTTINSNTIHQLGHSHGITVNSLAPGPIPTDTSRKFLKQADGSPTPLQLAMQAQTRAADRLGTVEDMADAALLLVSEKSRWITAQWISVSGGINM